MYLLLIVATIITTTLPVSEQCHSANVKHTATSKVLSGSQKIERGARFAAFYTPRAATTEWRPERKVNVLLAIHTDEERSNIYNLLANPAANTPGDMSGLEAACVDSRTECLVAYWGERRGVPDVLLSYQSTSMME